MIDKIKGILEGMTELQGWKITERRKEGQELFFVKKVLDMNRSKDVHDIDVTVYVAFEEDGVKYLGQSTTAIAPTLTEAEIRAKLKDTAKGAAFVKNPYFDLPKPTSEEVPAIENAFATKPLTQWMPLLAKAIYANDTQTQGGINSAEIFLTKSVKRIATSEGIDVTFDTYKAMVEVIADWNDGEEPVELFFLEDFGGYQPELLSEKIGDLINESKERAHATPTPSLKDVKVVLSGDAVKQLLDYYRVMSSARAKYEGISQFEIGQKLQGEAVSGDLLNVTLLPVLEGSSLSTNYDSDGVQLRPVELIKGGVLKTLHGNAQYAAYMDIPMTGHIGNFKVESGDLSFEEVKKAPYIELVSFSDFQTNPLTGDFGGEIRLARYFDGEKLTSVTGGAISANIGDVHSTMKLSKEVGQQDNFIGPKHIFFDGLEIVG